jgi:hypothetical protein
MARTFDAVDGHYCLTVKEILRGIYTCWRVSQPLGDSYAANFHVSASSASVAAGYGGSVSDALSILGVRDTVFADRFKPLR